VTAVFIAPVTSPTIFGMGVTVTIKPCVLGERDSRGNQTKIWPSAKWFEVAGVAIAPRTSDETNNIGFANRVVVGLTLYGPYSLEITHLDRVAYAGLDYEVVGEVGRWLNPFDGTQEGCEVALKRVA